MQRTQLRKKGAKYEMNEIKQHIHLDSPNFTSPQTKIKLVQDLGVYCSTKTNDVILKKMW